MGLFLNFFLPFSPILREHFPPPPPPNTMQSRPEGAKIPPLQKYHFPHEGLSFALPSTISPESRTCSPIRNIPLTRTIFTTILEIRFLLSFQTIFRLHFHKSISAHSHYPTNPIPTRSKNFSSWARFYPKERRLTRSSTIPPEEARISSHQYYNPHRERRPPGKIFLSGHKLTLRTICPSRRTDYPFLQT